MLVSVKTINGILILGFVWFLASLGTLSEVYLKGRTVKIIQILIYLTMGWVCAFDLSALKVALGDAAFFWVLLGGLSYTAGLFFYLADKLNRLEHAHGIWHFFVLLGAFTHFIAIIGFVR